MSDIFLVEDDARMTELLQHPLERAGHVLRVARSGESGLSALHERPADVIIVDIGLPDISGVEVLERIRRDHSRIPVIILTGHADLELAVEMMKKGAFDFLTKPVKPGALLATIDKAAALKRLLEVEVGGSRSAEGLERLLEQRSRELVEAQDRLSAVTARVSRLDQLSAAGRMASTMAHEVSNPMAAIQGYTELMLLHEELDPELSEAFTIIHRQCARVGMILRQYRNLTRLPAPIPSDTNVSGAVEDVLRLCTSYCVARKIRMQTDVKKDVRAVVDGPQLQQVLFNLVFNACQAMPDGGEIRAELREDTDEGWVMLSVRDTGVGIKREHLPRIFEDFFTTKEDCCGLGLSIVKDIVERHRGRIEVQSEPNKGSTFTVILPQRVPAAGAGDAATAPQAAARA